VTSVALLCDTSVARLVLEGWAFDPSDAPDPACAVAGAWEDLRTLEPFAQIAVSSRPDGGGLR
jgi:hypothetical protein